MIVGVEEGEGVLSISFQLEGSDLPKPTEKFQMGERKCKFHLPMGVKREGVHPDHLALVIIMLCSPFCRGRIRIPGGISKRFFELKLLFKL